MQPEQTPINNPTQPAGSQDPQPTPMQQTPTFNPPQGLPLQPPDNLPQADYTGYTGLIGYLNTPKGVKVGSAVIIIVIVLILLLLSAFQVISLGE